MRFDFTFGPSRPRERRDDDAPRRILVLSDLRGNGAGTLDNVSDRSILRVDVDNLDAVLAKCAPAIVLGGSIGAAELVCRTFEDFHPDTLVRTLPAFQRLRDLRARLQHPSTFAAAVAELQRDVRVAVPEGATAQSETAPPVADDGTSAFERLIGGKSAIAPSAPPATAVSAVDSLLRGIVAPHVVPAASPQLPQLLSAVDVAMTDLMRAVLHDPGFQQVEATWRGIQWLVSSLELGETLELHLLHVTRDELSKGVGPASDLHRKLVDLARGESGLELSALAANFRFDATMEDLGLLESLGELAHAVGAPLVAEGGAGLLGATSLAAQPDPRDWQPLAPDVEARWVALRAGPSRDYVGLALPRFLLRLPYGARSEAVEAFRFEEQPPSPEHESFLWGSPAFACAAVIARVLDAEGDLSNAGDIIGLPAFVFTTDDEPTLQPCAEVGLTERAMTAMLARGVMPLMSLKDRDAARLVRLQSIADPPTSLVG